MSEAPGAGRAATFAAYALVTVLAVAPHLPSLGAGFTLDDRTFVEVSASVRSLSEALSAFDEPFPRAEPERGLYRPLTNFSYALDYRLGGLTPAVFHASNLFWYALVCALVLAVARRLLDAPAAAFAAAAWFAAHPVHSEAVDSIAGRSELMALAGSLGAILAFTSGGRKSWRRLLLSVSLCAAAALAKETGLLTVAVLGAWLLLLDEPASTGRRARLLLPFAVLAVGYIALRFAVLGRLGPTGIAASAVTDRLWTGGTVFLENLRLLLAPVTLQIDFYYLCVVGVQSSASPRAIVGLALAAGAIAGTAFLAVRARRSSPRSAVALAAFAGITFFLFLLPTSHVIPFGALMAERFLLAPSFAAALLLGLGVRAAARSWRWAAWGFVAPLLVAFSVRSWVRARDWSDDVTLQSAALAAVPDAADRCPEFALPMLNGLSRGYLQRGDLVNGISALRLILERDPNFTPALIDLADVRLTQGDLDFASKLYVRILQLRPETYVAENGLGVIAARRGELAAAKARYLQALRLNPNYETAQRNLAAVAQPLQAALRHRAEHEPAAAAATNPGWLVDFAQACLASGDRAAARLHYERGRSLGLDPARRDPNLERLLGR